MFKDFKESVRLNIKTIINSSRTKDVLVINNTKTMKYPSGDVYLLLNILSEEKININIMYSDNKTYKGIITFVEENNPEIIISGYDKSLYFDKIKGVKILK